MKLQLNDERYKFFYKPIQGTTGSSPSNWVGIDYAITNSDQTKKSNLMEEPMKVFVMIPKEVLEEMRNGIRELLGRDKGYSEDYISEQQAQIMLGRKTTWFWQMRVKGRIGFSKIGNKIFYAKKDIEIFLGRYRKEAFLEKVKN